MFQRSKSTSHRPSHVLCYGYQKAPLRVLEDDTATAATGIPGIVSLHANESVQKLKSKPWTEILSLLGSSGDVILRNMLLDCGIFIRLNHGKDNLHQICGVPIPELLRDSKKLDQHSKPPDTALAGKQDKDSCDPRRPSSITFVRSRILYARPSINAQGGVRFGLKHIHVLNRYSDLTDSKQTVHIMKHIFPRQFGLHNVFTSITDKSETAQEFKDYTFREHEIKFAEHRRVQRTAAPPPVKTSRMPKRLRGDTFQMVHKIRKRHSHCSYTQLLRHYCSFKADSMLSPKFPASTESRQSSGRIRTQLSTLHSTLPQLVGQDETSAMSRTGNTTLTYATPTAQVSAFLRAVLIQILPGNALGVGADGKHNANILLGQVDQFVRMRRHESTSLHEVSQKLNLNCISWLRPPRMSSKAKMSQTDRAKRLEIFLELLYYIFDSILIPLIRSHFYVTESNVHRNNLFYFRHDVWQRLSEPSLAELRCTMFQGLRARNLRQARHSRLLGHSQLRLLPKEFGTRPIINLRRKLMRQQNGKTVLTHNINSKLMPCFAALNYERCLQPQKLGSSLFSIGEAHQRLKGFRSTASNITQRLYFVKMDVKSCFDSIPQDELVHMVQSLLSEHRYQISKHAELKPIDSRWSAGECERPLARFPFVVRPPKTPPGLSDTILGQLAQRKNRTVFADLWNSRSWDMRSLMKLLQEHVQRNVVKIDNRFFKQRRGIPQGSVLSSLLCNFFYGAFENNCLGFLQSEDSLLLRLIDDFLLVTRNQDHARRFAQVMMDGNPNYGIAVNPQKSLANFEVTINGVKIPRLHGSDLFPYCGVSINVHTLEVSKSRQNKDAKVSNGLTLELSRRQGLRLHRKVHDSLKLQMTAMLLDTNLNGLHCVSANLYQNFMESAMKMYRYVRGLPKHKRPCEAMIIATWKDLINLAVKMTRGKRSSKTIDEYECAISKTQMHWLAAAALEHVLQKKQTGYQKVLRWAVEIVGRCQAGMKTDLRTLGELREQAEQVFQRYQY